MTIKSEYWPWIIAAGILALAMYTISGIFLPFISGLLIAYAMHPMVTKLGKFGVRRDFGTFFLILSFFLVVGILLFVLIPFITVELVSLAGALPDYGKRLIAIIIPHLDNLSDFIGKDNIGDLQSKAGRYVGDMLSWGLNFLAKLLASTLALANLISLIIITPVVAFYMLRDWPSLLEKLSSLVPRQQVGTVEGLAGQMNDTLGAYVRGQSLVCLFMAFMYSLGLWLVGLKYAFTIGIVTGLLSFIPYVGMLIGVVAGIGIAFSQFDDWVGIAMVAIIFLIGNIFEGQFLSPNLVGGRIGLHPVWVIFALLAGGSLLGFLGLLLALPIAAVLSVLVRYGISRYMDSPFYGRVVVKRKKT
jgi:predicted PurR-regulated permease PerM